MTAGTRAALRATVTLCGMTGATVLIPMACEAGLYATTTLLALLTLGGAAAIVTRIARTGQIPRVVEHRPMRQSDRDAQRLRALLDHAPVPLLIRAADGTFHAANRAARRLFGTDDRLIDPNPPLLQAIAQLHPGERRTIRLPGRAGAPRSYALMVAQAGGQPGLSALIALTDIEAEINASEAQALRELLQVLSHEIMNSLTPVVSLAQSVHDMLDEPDADPAALLAETNAAIGVILRRTRGLDRFVQGYRMLARLPAPVLRSVRLPDVIAATRLLFQARWRDQVALDIATGDHAAHVRLDPELLEQALISLLTNGAEAALSGRAAAAGARPRVTLAIMVDQDALSIRIADNGDGVPPDHRETVFRAFFSLKTGGNGIGLSLARQIVQGHGGTLTLDDSMPGEGAVFVIRL